LQLEKNYFRCHTNNVSLLLDVIGCPCFVPVATRRNRYERVFFASSKKLMQIRGGQTYPIKTKSGMINNLPKLGGIYRISDGCHKQLTLRLLTNCPMADIITVSSIMGVVKYFLF
jgi:hypothetical protein